MTSVLIVDDEAQILRTLEINLRARGYTVYTADDGASALHEAGRTPMDVIILDLGLPDLDGVEVIRRLRGWTPTPVIVLSARHGSDDKVGALDAGADDYITKPFGLEELLARVRAVTRRSTETQDMPPVTTAAFTVDLALRRVSRDEQEIRLTPIEWSILEVLVRNPEKLVTQQQLLTQIWGPTYVKETQYLRVYMAQLRRKLELEPSSPRHLMTEAGVGYRFIP
jgi:two-component system, OmpR family, KDP operon response regulator KdpE